MDQNIKHPRISIRKYSDFDVNSIRYTGFQHQRCS